MPDITHSEFIKRFVAHMVAEVGEKFKDGASVAEYATATAEIYWDDESQRADGPEECADSDLYYGAEDDG